MDFFTSMEVSASGLAVQRLRMNVAASNLANVSTTETEEGGPYKRREVIVRSQQVEEALPGHLAGKFSEAVRAVEVSAIQEDQSDPRYEYDPGHPDADVDGYVAYPNINAITEMVDMITASRAYEAGITALSTAVTMAERALSIGR